MHDAILQEWLVHSFVTLQDDQISPEQEQNMLFCGIICTQRGPVKELKTISFAFQICIDIVNHVSEVQSYLKAYLQGVRFWKRCFVFLMDLVESVLSSLFVLAGRAFTEMQLCIVISLWSQSFSFLRFPGSLLENTAVMVCSSGYWTACKPLRQLIKTLLKGKCPLCS